MKLPTNRHFDCYKACQERIHGCEGQCERLAAIAPASPAPAKESATQQESKLPSSHYDKCPLCELPTKRADPEQPSAALADELEQWSMQLTANKQALQHYMDGFYALCIEHGVPASKAAGWAKHTEQAANTIHRIAERAIAAASLRSVEPAPRGEQINEIPLRGRHRIVRAAGTWQLFDGYDHVRWLNEHEREFIDCTLRIAREGKAT